MSTSTSPDKSLLRLVLMTVTLLAVVPMTRALPVQDHSLEVRSGHAQQPPPPLTLVGAFPGHCPTVEDMERYILWRNNGRSIQDAIFYTRPVQAVDADAIANNRRAPIIYDYVSFNDLTALEPICGPNVGVWRRASYAFSKNGVGSHSPTNPANTPTTTGPPANTVQTTTNAPGTTPGTSVQPTQGTTSALTSGVNSGVVTTTSVVAVTPTLPATTSAVTDSGSSKGFFQNTGAVAGTFSVVGLIVLGILVYFITFFLRRRRAAKLDRDIDEASAPAPVFLDDDPSEYHGGGGYMGGAGRSDASSHGTYAQPAMSTEAYGMREMNHPQAHFQGAGGYEYDPYTVAGVAAHEGYNNNNNNSYANHANAGAYDNYNPTTTYGNVAPQNQNQQYPTTTTSPPPASNYNGAYQNPHPQVQQYEGYYRGPGSPEHDLLEAAGMGVGAGVTRGMSLNHTPSYPTTNPTTTTYSPYAPAPAQDLQRGSSLASHSSYTHPSSHSAQYQPQQQAQQVQGYLPQHAEEDVTEDDAYGGYVLEHEPAHQQDHAGDERGSYHERPEVTRVLKIANE
ncbi:hypothetical protein H0H87_004722 [Tephrocybe sp. NHM501043]|nr:hypothetical protein H0H87_004722 [Tephrocybe sp. NHM501043]